MGAQEAPDILHIDVAEGYADPYGHILMLVRRVPQAGGAAGEFLAADAEPDGTVARKLFWRGNFLGSSAWEPQADRA